jgi:hypothetical protein
MSRALTAILTCITFAGCYWDDPGESVRIDQLEIDNDHEVGTRPEIEVYIIDHYTNDYLGCSGEDHGLEDVDVAHSTYRNLGAYFERPSGDRMHWGDHDGQMVRILVIEDDRNPCPAGAPSVEDDTVGESGPVPYSQLPGMQVSAPGFTLTFEER